MTEFDLDLPDVVIDITAIPIGLEISPVIIGLEISPVIIGLEISPIQNVTYVFNESAFNI